MGIYHIEYLCDYKSKDGHKLYRIKCNQCGYETDMRYDCIGKATICRHTTLDGNFVSHNYQWDNQRLAKIFARMKQRCYNSLDKDYFRYGGRGIKIYKKWLDNPKEFEKWSMENGYQDDLTIDRIDVDKNYCPTNCRWITLEDNSRYKSTTHLITVNGIVKTGREWSKTLNLGVNTINTYMREYGEEITKQLIMARLNDKNMQSTYRPNNRTWFDVYNIH